MSSKYKAVQVVCDGIKFDSKKERNYYVSLKLKWIRGDVEGFDLQVPFELQPVYKHNGKTIRAIYYVADFVVRYNDGHTEVIDVKGYRTAEYKLKKKLLLFKYPDINFVEV